MGKRREPGPAAQALHWPLFYAIRSVLAVPQILGPAPALEGAAAMGRWFGGLPMNRKRVDRAAAAIAQAFPEYDKARCHEVALTSYEHLFRLAIEVAFTPRLITQEGMTRHVELGNVSDALKELSGGDRNLCITGHNGNWELLAYLIATLGYPMHVVYRPLDMKPLDDWVRGVRSRRGLTLIDKFGAVRKLPGLVRSRHPIAFAADQNAGDRGVFVPFFGRLASTYKSIGLLAIETEATLLCGMARRLPGVAPGAADQGDHGFRYRIEIEDVIRPEDYMSQPDPLFYLTARYRRAIEIMVKRTPEQYLWMHRVWKSRPRHERSDRPFPESLKDKLRQLPWMTEDELARIVDRSDRDRATLRALGTDRLP
ncbi:MAG: lysophospholipid acyltransferase family protein [Planctomycetota bacterium]